MAIIFKILAIIFKILARILFNAYVVGAQNIHIYFGLAYGLAASDGLIYFKLHLDYI